MKLKENCFFVNKVFLSENDDVVWKVVFDSGWKGEKVVFYFIDFLYKDGFVKFFYDVYFWFLVFDFSYCMYCCFGVDCWLEVNMLFFVIDLLLKFIGCLFKFVVWYNFFCGYICYRVL